METLTSFSRQDLLKRLSNSTDHTIDLVRFKYLKKKILYDIQNTIK
jgi:hypothetical protein